jgi:hypothetical protein
MSSSDTDLSRRPSFLDKLRKPGKKICRSLSSIISRKRSGSIVPVVRQHSQSFSAYETTTPEAEEVVLAKKPDPWIIGKSIAQQYILPMPNAYDIQFLPNQEMLCATANAILRLNENQVSCFVSDVMPRGMSLTREGYVLFCDLLQDNIQAFTRGGSHNGSFATGYFKRPRKINANSKDHFAVIDDEGCYLYNPMTGQKDKLLDDAHSLVFDKQDQLYISRAQAECVHVFDADGHPSNHINIASPSCVCIHRDCVFIVSESTLKAFSMDDQFIGNLLTLPARPTAMTICDQQMAVLINEQLIIYEICDNL